MKSHSNSEENIPKYVSKNNNNNDKSMGSYDICEENTNNLTKKCTDSVDVISESELIVENACENNNTQSTQQIDYICENENVSANDNETLLNIAHTIISGNATIQSLAKEEMYDLDSMLFLQPTNYKLVIWFIITEESYEQL